MLRMLCDTAEIILIMREMSERKQMKSFSSKQKQQTGKPGSLS